VVNITCNKSNGPGRIADSGAADGVPNGFLIGINWTQRTGGGGSQQCPTDLGATANVEPFETNGATPGTWSLTAEWTADGEGINGTATLLDVRGHFDVPDVGGLATCYFEGDTDGDGVFAEGDRALPLDLDNPSNVLANEPLVGWDMDSEGCPSTLTFTAHYVLRGNTDNDADPKYNDNLFIRRDDA
jgi:hypothetical protein